MKKIKQTKKTIFSIFLFLSVFLFGVIYSAESATSPRSVSDKTLGGIIVGIINELSVYFITLIAGASLLFFIWGVTKYIWKGDSEDARKTGRQFMIWGIIGLFVMFGVWGIVGLIGNTFGVKTVIPQFSGSQIQNTSNQLTNPVVKNPGSVGGTVNKPVVSPTVSKTGATGSTIKDKLSKLYQGSSSWFSKIFHRNK